MTAPAVSTALRWGGGVVIAVVAVVRCVIFFAAHLVFDVDPLVDAAPLHGLGPAGSLGLDVVLLLACAAAILGEAIAGRRLEWPLLTLAVIPVPVVLWHGASDAEDLWRGATWAAAMIAAVTVAHLARERRLRIVLGALLLAVLGPLIVRGAANVTYEYNDTLRTFEAHQDEMFASKGWEPDSPQALIFERRLRHRQPTGWFVTTNIYASVMAFALVACVGLAIASARSGMPSGWAGLMILLALVAGVAVWATGSKGAILTAAAGIVLVVAPFVQARIGAALARYGKIVAIVCVLGALGGVLVRGTLLPESFAGDRSLLFRWHYTVSAAQIVAEEPVVGVGPGGFQAAYVTHRLPRNPEEVASAHSVFWDWLAGLGVGAVAWIAVTFVLLWRAGGSMTRLEEAADHRPLAMAGTLLVVAALLIGLAFGLGAESAGLDAFVGIVRGLGVVLALLVGLAVAYLLFRVDRTAAAWAFAAAAIVLAVHAQIEMTLTQPGAAVWCLCAIGLSGWKPDGKGASRAFGVVLAVVLVAAAGWLTATGVVPSLRSERAMIEAARTIGAAAESPSPGAESAARSEAADLLAGAYAQMPTSLYPRLMAAEQLERVATQSESVLEKERILRDALAHVDHAIARGARGHAQVIAISIHRRLAQVMNDANESGAAIDIARDMVEADPHGLGPRRRLADLLWEAGRRDEAKIEYQRTLDIDDAFELDPLKQLPARDRAEVERRIRS